MLPESTESHAATRERISSPSRTLWWIFLRVLFQIRSSPHGFGKMPAESGLQAAIANLNVEFTSSKPCWKLIKIMKSLCPLGPVWALTNSLTGRNIVADSSSTNAPGWFSNSLFRPHSTAGSKFRHLSLGLSWTPIPVHPEFYLQLSLGKTLIATLKMILPSGCAMKPLLKPRCCKSFRTNPLCN